MELNKKCLDIMAGLTLYNDYVSVEELANRYGISPRGIRYNLDKIEQYITSNGHPYLKKERTKGVKLSDDPALHNFIKGCAGQLDPYQYSFSSTERQTFLRVSLLMATEPVRIEDLCRSLTRSRGTLFGDVEDTQQWLSGSDIHLIKKPRVGLYCEGAENVRRLLITSLFMEEVDLSDLLGFFSDAKPRSRLTSLLLSHLAKPHEVSILAKTARRVESLLQKNFSDETFAALLIQLLIILRRNSVSSELQINEKYEEFIPQSVQYGAARLALDELETQLKIMLPEYEILWFTRYLLGAKELPCAPPQSPKVDDIPLMDITTRMVEDIESMYQVDFAEHKKQIMWGIFQHLRPVAHRVRFGLYNKNPLYHEIVSNYNPLFINTRVVCRHLEQHLGYSINDQEVSFLTLHFAAALHKLNLRTNIRARVLVVCGTGLASAQMLTSGIDRLFNVDIVGAVSGRQATDMHKEGLDCIITTIPLSKAPCPIVQISPLLGEQDLKKLMEHLTPRYIPKERYDMEVSTVNRLMSIIEKHCVITDRLQLQHALLGELMNSSQPLLSSLAGSQPSLSQFLTREQLTLGLTCSDDWRESIRTSCALLEAQNVVTPDYKEAIIRSLEEMGPYMVMLPGIVLAHAAPEDGVLELGMSLSTLSRPVRFGYAAHDPVNIIVTLAAKDEKSHLKALAQLFRMLRDGETLRTILNGTKDDILQCIARYSQ